MKCLKHGLLSGICFLILLSCKEPEKKISYELGETLILNKGWSFQRVGEKEWLPATVPGCVHTDLLDNGKIPDPFHRNNEKQLQWIDKNNWVYRCDFKLSKEQIQHQNLQLRFKGLDTYATIELNGIDILSTVNMFRSWTVNAKPFLLEGNNRLTVTFTSPIIKGLEKLDELGYALPAANDQSRNGGLGDQKVSVFVRKAPYHFGWDWGPRFVTSGIWRPVELTMFNNAKIDNVYFQQTNLNSSEASVDALFDIEVAEAGDYEIHIFENKSASEPFVKIPQFLDRGTNSITIPFTIFNPELWWPNGMGDPHLYNLHIRLSRNEVVVDTLSQKMGVRSINLVREPDPTGTSFYFEVNGKPLFAKGANYIPNDNFLNRVTHEKYEDIIRSAAESNMNMLRVWGGGIYENDIFYELCDKYGILVWQDFMFACSMYPGDDQFLENVRLEAIDNVKRLQNHPSIALWCGNNEIDGAWCEGNMNCGWGWKQRYTANQRKEIWHSYDTLFHKILPDVVAAYDPTRDYWPSSPQADWNEHADYNTTNKGDIHYWGVWHGNEPFSNYFKIVGRFMSEYGFQSLPDMESIKQFTRPEDWDFESEVLLSHQRSGYGNSRIIDYMKKLYPVPEDFNELLYVGQVMQAEAIKSAILAHRSQKPHCMGTLYWQLNDCWPAASWSSIDYYGSWKALQYFAKKAYAPVSITFHPEEGQVRVFINSDLQKSKQVSVQYSICDFKGEILKEEKLLAILDHQRGTEVFSLNEKNIDKSYDASSVYLQVKILEGDNVLAKDHYFFEAPKNLKLPASNISLKTKKVKGEMQVTINADALVKNLYIWVEGCPSRLSDNYFDVLPGEEVQVRLPVYEENQNIKTLSLNSIINPE